MKSLYILIITTLFFGFTNTKNVNKYTVNRNNKIKKLLCTKKWSLIRFEEILNTNKTTYTGIAYPNFLSDGTYIDATHIPHDSLGNIKKMDWGRWALGAWKLNGKTISINILEYSKDFSDRIVGGDMEIKSISDSTLTLFKKITRNNSWNRTYYFTAR